jgi:hypothetical protein
LKARDVGVNNSGETEGRHDERMIVGGKRLVGDLIGFL